jgi:glutamine---fructose-6-phosphate transaminase (isomerizing)
MCGIYGAIGTNASKLVLEGLRKLEYRGYDSAGLAAIFHYNDKSNTIEFEKSVGYVSNLVSKANGRFDGSKIAIGHTRWATHGEVNYDNAHPHNSNDGKISLVHNGIIENSMQLSKKVKELGYKLESETDTEVIVHLFHHELSIQGKSKDFLSAFQKVIIQLEGSWAIAIISSELDGILISRKGAPLIIGKGIDGISISSDIQTFYGACSEVAFINDGDTFLIHSDKIVSIDNCYLPDFVTLDGVYDEQDPGIYPHMMLKEIFDQPTALSNALSGRINANGKTASLNGFKLSRDEIMKLNKINLVGCGTAFYACKIVAEYIRKFSNVPVEAFRSSEFPAKQTCSSKTLTIGFTQSGETKDTLDALINAKKYDSNIASICNVIGSTISRLTGNGAYIYAGQEYAVASTKVYTNMIAIGLLFALNISDMSKNEKSDIIQNLRKLPNLISQQLIEDDGSIMKSLDILENSKNIIFLGRGPLSSNLAEEGALKMMEVTYIPCLSYPGGELKHGPISLIESGTPIIAIVPSDSYLNLMESSIRECKSRGAKIILITDYDGPIIDLADIVIPTMKTHLALTPMINIIPLQLLAYNLGIRRGINVDRPRNLAKSVTVI